MSEASALRIVNGHPWCPVCHKFTKKDGTHNCDPNWREALKRGRQARAASGTTRRRRWRLTPSSISRLKKLAAQAAAFQSCKGSKTVKQNLAKRKKTIEKRAESIMKSLKIY